MPERFVLLRLPCMEGFPTLLPVGLDGLNGLVGKIRLNGTNLIALRIEHDVVHGKKALRAA